METVTIPKDQELEAVQKQIVTVVQKAQAFQLVSNEALETAAKVLSWIAATKKKIEERRKFFVQPLNTQVDRINDLFKGYVRPLNEARSIMDEKIIAWNRKQEADRIAEEKRVREEAEKLAKKMKVPVQEIIASAPVQEVQKTVGTLTITKRWTFEVTEPLLIPREYLVADTVKIGQAIRDGIRIIKGIRIYEKEVTSTK